jgi:surface protein
MFNNCSALVSFPQLDTSSVTDMGSMLRNCPSLVSIPHLDTSKVKGVYEMSNMVEYCYSIKTAKIKNIKFALKVKNTSLLNKESLLYIINNEAATSAITITLSSYVYDKFVNDADVVAALANHPNISIAK